MDSTAKRDRAAAGAPPGRSGRAPRRTFNDELQLRAMLAGASEVLELVSGCTPEALVANTVLRLAVERLLQRVADAGQRVTPAVRRSQQQLPWARLDLLSDTLSTARPPVDGRILYAIAAREAPALIEALHTALPGDED